MVCEKSYKVIFIGTAAFAVPVLQGLDNCPDFLVEAVLTQPDKPALRFENLHPSPVKVFAIENNLPVLQPETLSNSISIIEGLKPDFIVVAAYGQILPSSILRIPKYGCLNVHASLLPKYRGASPVQAALLAGDSETGVSIIQMEEKVDEGDILIVNRIPIDKNDNAEILAHRLSMLGAVLLIDAMHLLIDLQISPIPQSNKDAICCRKIFPSDGRILWDFHTAEEILNQIRAFTPWPGCFTFWDRKRLKILQVQSVAVTGKPCKVFLKDGKLGVYAKKGALHIERLQLEGKKQMDACEFLSGYSGIEGALLRGH